MSLVNRKTFLLLAVVCSLISPWHSYAKNEINIKNEDDDLTLINELMRAETVQALKNTLSYPLVTKAKELNEDSSGASKPVITAIYGVGTSVSAEVLWRDMLFTYKSGQTAPLGFVESDYLYMLEGIKGRCVGLKLKDQVNTYCIRRSIRGEE